MASSKNQPPKGVAKKPASKRKQSGPSRGLIIGIAVALAVVIGGGLLLLNMNSDTGSGNKASAVATGDVAAKDEITTLLAGIPQKGAVLGFDEAPVTLIEYGDLRCPSCRQWDTTIAPQVIEQLVRTKKAKLEFKLWPITSDAQQTNVDAIHAAQAGLAAAKQDKFWSFALLFYKNQQDESTTYVTTPFITGLATAAGIPDIAKFQKDAVDAASEAELQDNGVVATSSGFTGTPSFMTQKGTDAPVPFKGDSDFDSLKKALGL